MLLTPYLSFAEDSIDDFSPISHWDCDELNGVRYDSNTVASNDLTDNNTVTYATGKLSNACDFESTNSEYLSITDLDQSNLDLSGNITISVWLYFESLPSVAASIVGKWNNDTAERAYQIWWYNTTTDVLVFEKRSTTNAEVYESVSWTPSINTWYHVVVTYNSSTGDVKFYVDGTQLGSTQTSTPADVKNTSTPFNIGYRTPSGLYFDGLIDEVTIMASELTSSQVTTLYNAGTPLPYTYTAPATSSTSTTASSTSSTLNSDDIVFALGVIIFFLTFIWFGFIVSTFKKA